LKRATAKASLDQIRTHLGHAQSERAYATGMALSPGEALDLAAGYPTESLARRRSWATPF